MGLHQAATRPAPALVTGPEALASGFRAAMRRLASGVAILATRHGGVPVGMAATSVSSLAANPASVLISVSHGASLCQPLLVEGRFTVNLLRVAQAGLVPLFSGKLKGPARFNHGDWAIYDGLPVLADAQAVLVCRVAQRMTFADHEVIAGVIEALAVRDGIAPLLWQNGRAAVSRPLPG
jgi:flavin reductase (DIM6/NTAB) family NADH-FMN oxidoreductase RutF